MQNCQYTRFLHIIVYTVYRIALYVTIYILKIWWKLLTWLLIRREAKNIFTKVFRLVSAELSIYTGFTNNRIYGLSYIIICYRIYILKKSRISVLQQHRYGLNPRRESGIHGNLGSQAGNESQNRILGSTGVWDPWGPRE